MACGDWVCPGLFEVGDYQSPVNFWVELGESSRSKFGLRHTSPPSRTSVHIGSCRPSNHHTPTTNERRSFMLPAALQSDSPLLTSSSWIHCKTYYIILQFTILYIVISVHLFPVRTLCFRSVTKTGIGG